jgi:RimJ/RimL family protein N-acetyltransferase
MIVICPFPTQQAPELHRWLTTPADPNFDDYAPRDLAGVTAALRAKSEAGYTFAAVLDDLPIGFVGFAPASPVAGWFAGMVMAPEYRGRGFGGELLCRAVWILRAKGFRKLSAFFFADNHAIRATFRSAGAVEEGYLRGASMRGGELVDMRLWSFNEGSDA